MANKALINYYAKLVQRGYDKAKIPDDMLPAVEEKLLQLPPRVEDPETETPEEK